MATIEIDVLDTPLGHLELAVHDGALVTVKFDDRWGSGVDQLSRHHGDVPITPAEDPAGMTSALRRYFEGDVNAIDGLSVDVRGTPFQEAVWKALLEVPAGKTATYGEIARVIGSPRAVRAVGTAVGSNPVGIVVPCHRVLPASGGVGNYGGGVDRKAWLLAHEGVEV